MAARPLFWAWVRLGPVEWACVGEAYTEEGAWLLMIGQSHCEQVVLPFGVRPIQGRGGEPCMA